MRPVVQRQVRFATPTICAWVGGQSADRVGELGDGDLCAVLVLLVERASRVAHELLVRRAFGIERRFPQRRARLGFVVGIRGVGWIAYRLRVRRDRHEHAEHADDDYGMSSCHGGSSLRILRRLSASNGSRCALARGWNSGCAPDWMYFCQYSIAPSVRPNTS